MFSLGIFSFLVSFFFWFLIVKGRVIKCICIRKSVLQDVAVAVAVAVAVVVVFVVVVVVVVVIFVVVFVFVIVVLASNRKRHLYLYDSSSLKPSKCMRLSSFKVHGQISSTF